MTPTTHFFLKIGVLGESTPQIALYLRLRLIVCLSLYQSLIFVLQISIVSLNLIFEQFKVVRFLIPRKRFTTKRMTSTTRICWELDFLARTILSSTAIFTIVFVIFSHWLAYDLWTLFLHLLFLLISGGWCPKVSCKKTAKVPWLALCLLSFFNCFVMSVLHILFFLLSFTISDIWRGNSASSRLGCRILIKFLFFVFIDLRWTGKHVGEAAGHYLRLDSVNFWRCILLNELIPFLFDACNSCNIRLIWLLCSHNTFLRQTVTWVEGLGRKRCNFLRLDLLNMLRLKLYGCSLNPKLRIGACIRIEIFPRRGRVMLFMLVGRSLLFCHNELIFFLQGLAVYQNSTRARILASLLRSGYQRWLIASIDNSSIGQQLLLCLCYLFISQLLWLKWLWLSTIDCGCWALSVIEPAVFYIVIISILIVALYEEIFQRSLSYHFIHFLIIIILATN